MKKYIIIEHSPGGIPTDRTVESCAESLIIAMKNFSLIIEGKLSQQGYLITTDNKNYWIGSLL